MEEMALGCEKGSKPEKFYFVTVDLSKAIVTSLESGLTEKQIKERLAKQEIPEAEIEHRIAAARKKPV